MKRILILIADYGFGHHSAANTISEALQETYGGNCVVEIVNALDDKRAPAFLRKEQVITMGLFERFRIYINWGIKLVIARQPVISLRAR